MMELLGEEPLFDKDAETVRDLAKNDLTTPGIDPNEESYWRMDRYQLYKPTYDPTWNNQEIVELE